MGSNNGERRVAWVSWEVMIRPKFMGGLGFRDLVLFNLALLARKACWLLMEPNSLSARILKSVYYKHTGILDASLGSHRLIRRLGDGASTEIWRHNWLPRECSMKPITVSPSDGPVFV